MKGLWRDFNEAAKQNVTLKRHKYAAVCTPSEQEMLSYDAIEGTFNPKREVGHMGHLGRYSYKYQRENICLTNIF